jgi:hypothetical protein
MPAGPPNKESGTDASLITSPTRSKKLRPLLLLPGTAEAAEFEDDATTVSLQPITPRRPPNTTNHIPNKNSAL